MDTSSTKNFYLTRIREEYTDLVKRGGQEPSNYDLAKIFEYYCCVKLSEIYGRQFYHYNDISPSFKEDNRMSRQDTGIDLCDLNNIIVQCKLRADHLSFRECATFFASQNTVDSELKKTVVRWPQLVLARNADSKLSKALCERKNFELFDDQAFDRPEFLRFCDDLVKSPPPPLTDSEPSFRLRDYQTECIDLITQNAKNVAISLPTGTGKNAVIIYSMRDNHKYLILVPRIILLEQFREQLIKHKPHLRTKIQCIGDGKHKFDENKTITICIFNSVNRLKCDFSSFDKIFVDEAHHVARPEIYNSDESLESTDTQENDDDSIVYESDKESVNSDIPIDTEIETHDIAIDDDCEAGRDDSETPDIAVESDDDEMAADKNYMQTICGLRAHNNNVYLSATLDRIEGFEYYSKDVRSMIERKFISDYDIRIPIFSDDPTDKHVCQYLIHNYRRLIIYCNSRKEGVRINNLMNELQNGCSAYLDGLTSRQKRQDILRDYQNGDVLFLVNVRILVEGFDSAITRGVVFIHMPKSKTAVIQIIGRALRLHPSKNLATVILPFSAADDGNEISQFLAIIARNDCRIKKSYESRNTCGYISIEKVDRPDANDNSSAPSDEIVEFRYDLIYDSMGVLSDVSQTWDQRLETAEQYLSLYGKRPSTTSSDKAVRALGYWIHAQVLNYKRKCRTMVDEARRTRWETFVDAHAKLFVDSDQRWCQNLNRLEKFIVKEKRKPLRNSENDYEKHLGVWTCAQQENYSQKMKSMSDPIKKKMWEDFIEHHKGIFKTRDEIWDEQFNNAFKWISKEGKRPSSNSSDAVEMKLSKWICTEECHSNKEILTANSRRKRKRWLEFKLQYPDAFRLTEDKQNELRSALEKLTAIDPKLSEAKLKSSEAESQRSALNAPKFKLDLRIVQKHQTIA